MLSLEQFFPSFPNNLLFSLNVCSLNDLRERQRHAIAILFVNVLVNIFSQISWKIVLTHSSNGVDVARFVCRLMCDGWCKVLWIVEEKEMGFSIELNNSEKFVCLPNKRKLYCYSTKMTIISTQKYKLFKIFLKFVKAPLALHTLHKGLDGLWTRVIRVRSSRTDVSNGTPSVRLTSLIK